MNLMQNIPPYKSLFEAIAAPVVFTGVTSLLASWTYQRYIDNTNFECDNVNNCIDYYLTPVLYPLGTLVAGAVTLAGCIKTVEYFTDNGPVLEG